MLEGGQAAMRLFLPFSSGGSHKGLQSRLSSCAPNSAEFSKLFLEYLYRKLRLGLQDFVQNCARMGDTGSAASRDYDEEIFGNFKWLRHASLGKFTMTWILLGRACILL